MATAMREDPSSITKSVAERKCRKILDLKLAREDNNLSRFLLVWEDEVSEEAERLAGGLITFDASVTLRGKWAAKLIPLTPPDTFPETRKLLANRVVDAWLNCKDPADEEYFAQAIRDWSPLEVEMMSSTIRSILKFRNGTPDRYENTTRRIIRFLAASKDNLVMHVTDSVYRTMFKALGVYGTLDDLKLAVTAVHAEHVTT